MLDICNGKRGYVTVTSHTGSHGHTKSYAIIRHAIRYQCTILTIVLLKLQTTSIRACLEVGNLMSYKYKVGSVNNIIKSCLTI
jgi:hypothetical protein